MISIGAQSTFFLGGETFLPENICMKKISKILELYTIFARKILFSGFFFGGGERMPHAPVFYAYAPGFASVGDVIRCDEIGRVDQTRQNRRRRRQGADAAQKTGV